MVKTKNLLYDTYDDYQARKAREKEAEQAAAQAAQDEKLARNRKLMAYLQSTNAPIGFKVTDYLDQLSATGEMDGDTKKSYDAERLSVGQDPTANYALKQVNSALAAQKAAAPVAAAEDNKDRQLSYTDQKNMDTYSGILSKQTMPGQNHSVLDEVRFVSSMADGEEKENRKKSLLKELKKSIKDQRWKSLVQPLDDGWDQGDVASIILEGINRIGKVDEFNENDLYSLLTGETRDADFWDVTLNSLTRGYNNALYGEESYEAMLGNANEKEKYENILANDDYNFETDNWFENAVSGASELLGQQVRQWTNPTSLALGTSAAATAVIAGNAGPQAILPEEVVTAPTAFLAGMGAGSAGQSLKIEAGLAYNEMLEVGISEETAKKVALAVGTVNAGLEALQIDELLDAYKATKATGATKSFTKKILEELLERGVDVAKETAQEVAQEGVTIAGTQTASKADKGEWAYSADEVGGRLLDTAKSSALSFGLMNTPAAVRNSVSIGVNQKKQATIHNTTLPQKPADTAQTAANETGENGQPQTQTGPTQAVATPDPAQKALDIVNSTIAQMHGDPANPLDTALEYFRENGTVSNKLADAISRSPDAVRTLVDEVGLRELPKNASDKRAAIKQAVTDYAQKQTPAADDSAAVDSSPVTTSDTDQKAPAQKEHISMEDYANNESPVWRNVEYADDETKATITQETHDRMVSAGAVVKVSKEVLGDVEQSFPDLRSMKKKDRTPILKDAIGKLKNNLRQFLNKFSGQGFEFEVNGKILDATLYSTGINEVLEKVTQEKANMLYSTEDIFRNAQYLYSTPDYGGDPNVYRWNYFYTPVQIGEDTVGVRIAVRDMVKGTDGNTPESQIYNWGIKKDASLDGGSHGQKAASSDVSSDASNNIIDQGGEIVNPLAEGQGETTSTTPPHESVGAADANFTGKQAYYDLLSDDNVKPGRPGDVRDVEIPETDGYGRRVPDFATNAVGAEVTTDEMADAIEELIGEGALGFDVKSDKSLFEAAAADIKKDKLAGSRNKVTKAAMGGKAKDADIAKAMLLYNIYNQKGDIDNASEIMVDLATMANDAGRKLRLFGLLRKMTPEGQAAVVQKTVQRTVDRINKSRSGKTQAEVTIPQELMDAYTDAARRDSHEHSEDSERAKVEAEQAIYEAAAAQIKASPMEKLNAWRYMAMLGNVKTQIRNIAGNALFRPLVSTKRAIGAAIESVTLEQKDRTKAVLGFGKDAQELIRWAGEDAQSKTTQELLSYCGQTGDAAQTAIDENRQIFDTKWLESVREFVKKVPEGADMLFKKREYSLSLASFLKARGYTAADIQSGKVSQDVLNEGRAYAAQEALKATFNDQNALSDLITNMRYKGDDQALQLLNILGEGVMPFRRTPANIVARGLEYRPIGLVRGLGNAAVNVRSGKVSAATAIDQIAAGLTGTGMMALGWALASGIFGIRLRGKVEEEEELSGHQSFALEIGGKSYDISWLAPANLPLLVGANLYELGSKNGNEDNWLVNAASATVTALEPLLELSCLSSLNDVIESVRYAGDGEGLYAIAASAATSYLTQYIPTLLGQMEQAVEDTKKSTYSNADTPLERSLEKTVGRITQRIPGIDLFQTEKVDKWGRTQEKGGLQKAFDAFINPSKVTTIEETAADEELERLRNSVPDENVYPGSFRKEISYTDSEGKTQKKALTAEEYAELAKTQGQQSRELVEKITGMEDYKGLTDAQKAKVIQRIYDYTAAVSKSAVVDCHEEPSWITNRAKGMSIEEAILRQEIVGTTQLYTDLSIPKAAKVATLLKGILPEEGHTNTRTIQKVEAVTGADSFLSEKEQKDVLEDILPDETFDKYVEILAAGYSSDDFATAYRIDLDIEGEGAKEKTIKAFMKEFGITKFTASKLYDLYHPDKES